MQKTLPLRPRTQPRNDIVLPGNGVSALNPKPALLDRTARWILMFAREEVMLLAENLPDDASPRGAIWITIICQ
jgi:hypothetical protein